MQTPGESRDGDTSVRSEIQGLLQSGPKLDVLPIAIAQSFFSLFERYMCWRAAGFESLKPKVGEAKHTDFDLCFIARSPEHPGFFQWQIFQLAHRLVVERGTPTGDALMSYTESAGDSSATGGLIFKIALKLAGLHLGQSTRQAASETLYHSVA